METGLGKTPTVIALACHLLDVGELTAPADSPLLVYVTDAPAVIQTARALRKFLPDHLSVVAVSEERALSASKPSAKALATYAATYGEDGPAVIVAGYDWVSRRTATTAATWQPALTVLDEAGCLIGDGPVQQGARTLSSRSRRCVGMTATPWRSNPMQTFRILQAVGTPGLWDEPFFSEEYATWTEHQPSPWAKPQRKPLDDFTTPWHEEDFKDYLHRQTTVVTVAEAALRMPEVLHPEPVWVALPASAQALYDKADRTNQGFKALERIGRGLGADTNLPAALVQQLTGPYKDRRAVVWSMHPKVLTKVADALTAAGITSLTMSGKTADDERDRILDRFRDGEAQVLLGSHVLQIGLEIQVCDLLVSLDCSETSADERQREGRLARIGSLFDTVTHLYLLPDTPVVRAKWKKLAKRGAQAKQMLSTLV